MDQPKHRPPNMWMDVQNIELATWAKVQDSWRNDAETDREGDEQVNVILKDEENELDAGNVAKGILTTIPEDSRGDTTGHVPGKGTTCNCSIKKVAV